MNFLVSFIYEFVLSLEGQNVESFLLQLTIFSPFKIILNEPFRMVTCSSVLRMCRTDVFGGIIVIPE
ncbi:MAG: hypothetical protein CM1200mP30_32050 [Pseudomonadota bacterium]|nr:MAG: hypothetical protein CM1200mP30_32050 [Pseudomonadota bacterium]